MNPDHLVYLRCPKTKRALIIEGAETSGNKIKSGKLVEPLTGNTYPIIDFIPRFVELDNYSASFGIEWNIHDQTQYDNSSKRNISKDRYENQTKWGYRLTGEVILEAGSGSGRFTEILLQTGAMCISFDYSNAVDANYRSNGHHKNLLLIQASIFEMPFDMDYFHRVLCIGVLQHTPDPKLAFSKLTEVLKPQGSICTDIYLKSLGSYYLTPKYLVRGLTTKMDPEKLYHLTVRYVNFMWPLAKLLMKIPKVGKMINWRLLIADYSYLLVNADDKTLKDWAILDTYDMVSPAHDHPSTLKQFRRWHTELNLHNIDVHYGHNGIEGRAIKR